MLSHWLYIGIFMLVALFLPTIAITLAGLISPKRPNSIKNSTYECGIETVGDTWIQFKVQYYIYALVFVVFDVESVFLFPIAAAYDQLTLFAAFEVVVFVLILVVGLGYAWSKGALEWT